MADAANTNSRAELLHLFREAFLYTPLLLMPAMLFLLVWLDFIIVPFLLIVATVLFPLTIVGPGRAQGVIATSRVLRVLPVGWQQLGRIAWWLSVVVFPGVALIESALSAGVAGMTLTLFSLSLVGSGMLLFATFPPGRVCLNILLGVPLWLLLFSVFVSVTMALAVQEPPDQYWVWILPGLALAAAYISWRRMPLLLDPAAFKRQDRQEKPFIFRRAFEFAAAPVVLQERLPLPVFFFVTLLLQALVGVLQMLLVFAVFGLAVAPIGALVAPFIFLLGGLFMTGTVLETWIERLRVLRHLPMSPWTGAGLILGGGIMALLVYTATLLLVRALVWPSISWEQVLFMVLLMLCLELAWVISRLAFWSSRAASEMVTRIVVVCAMVLSVLGLPLLVQVGIWVVFALLLGLGVGLSVVLRQLGMLQPLRG
jgi:hypothetical protein